MLTASAVLSHLKKSPRVYDFLDRLRPIRDPLERYLSSLPKSLSFLQIGANDGLRWDPLRRFVVKNRWTGVFVEPIPYSFSLLKRNYDYLARRKSSDLRFVNAAITAGEEQHLVFWSFTESFLAPFSLEEKMFYLRKASFELSNVQKFLPPGCESQDVIAPTEVDAVSINRVFQEYFDGAAVDLVMIDAEGYDHVIVGSIDFSNNPPRNLIFEAHSSDNDTILSLLSSKGYTILDLGGDVAATRHP